MRRCSKCGVGKPEAEFYVRKPGVLQSECKPCMREGNMQVLPATENHAKGNKLLELPT